MHKQNFTYFFVMLNGSYCKRVCRALWARGLWWELDLIGSKKSFYIYILTWLWNSKPSAIFSKTNILYFVFLKIDWLLVTNRLWTNEAIECLGNIRDTLTLSSKREILAHTIIIWQLSKGHSEYISTVMDICLDMLTKYVLHEMGIFWTEIKYLKSVVTLMTRYYTI